MGKGSGGGSQTVQQNADPWSGARPYLIQGMHNLQQIFQHGNAPTGSVTIGDATFDGGVNTPEYYPNSTVAPMSPWTSGALQSQYQRGANGSPVTDSAQNENMRTTGGFYLHPDSNPYLRANIDYATAPVEAAANSAFSAAGRYGSGSHMDQLGRSIGEIASNMAGQNYSNERNRQLTAAGQAAGLANQDYLDINQAGAAGSALDAYNQNIINADVERFNYGQDADWRRVQDFLGTINGVAPTGSSSVSRQTPNAFSSILGGGLGAAGIASMLWPMFSGGSGLAGAGALAGLMMSDENLKYDIEEVGELHNGLPIYTYHYVDEPADAPKHMGVMAQEALQVRPEAVGMLHGFLAVDYDKVTEDA